MSENIENKNIPESELAEVSGGKVRLAPIVMNRQSPVFVVTRKAYSKDRRKLRERRVPFTNRTCP